MSAALVLLLLSADPGRVIPPHQEAVLAPALGQARALPAGCVWQGASIQPTFIESKYACPDEPELVLRIEVRIPPREGHSFVAPDAGPPELVADVLAALERAPLSWEPELKNEHASRTRFTVPHAAWVALIISLVVLAATRMKTLPREALVDGAAVFIVALVLRALVPWGPLDFAEPERLSGLWNPERATLSGWSSFSAAFDAARLAGVALSAYRWFGPVLGATTCVVVLALARRLGVSRVGALLAALTLATWPVHVRFSASGNPALLAGLLWVAVLLLTMDERPEPPSPAALLALGALVVLAVHARAEGRFVVLPLAVWLWNSPLSRRGKVLFSLGLGPMLVPWAVDNLVPSGSDVNFGTGVHSLFETLRARGVTPDWSLVAGLVGLALVGLSRTQRTQLVLVFAAVLLSACAFGSEDNPLWGHWRYLVPLLPFLALGVGRAFDAAVPKVGVRAARTAGVLAVLLPLVVLRGVLFRPVDLQEEFRFVLRTARELPADVVLTFDSPPAEGEASGDTRGNMAFVHFELTPGMAAALAGRSVDFVGEPARFAGDHVLFQGLARKQAARRTLPPEQQGATMMTERVRVAPLAQVMNSQCPRVVSSVRPKSPPVLGWSLEDCEVEFSWVRVR